MLDILDCFFWMLEGFCKGGYIILEIGEGEAEQIIYHTIYMLQYRWSSSLLALLSGRLCR